MSVETAYRANAFTPETGSRVNVGRLLVTLDSVRFEGEQIHGKLPLEGLRLRRGGHNNEQIFFEHPSMTGWSIYSSDETLLRDPILSANPQFSGVLRAIDRSRRATPFPLILAAAVGALILGLLVVLWVSKDRIAEYIAEKIPVSWEEKFGDQVFQQVASRGKILLDSPWQKAVEDIADRLRPAVLHSGYQFKFHILQDTNVNAFAIPGGHVLILTGLLESADNSEEVAGVIAHELAHVTRRHSLRNIIKAAGLIVVIQAALGDASGVLALAAEGSRYLLQQKFSRDFEREADDTGWTYLVDAKIDPRGMIGFFEKMKEMMADSGLSAMEGSLSFLNTHPTSQERIDRLKKKWEALPVKSFEKLETLKKK